MKELVRAEFVTSVISASANNSVSYRDNHRSFLPFDHETAMSEQELKAWRQECRDMSEQELKSLVEATGGAPLQVAKYLENFGVYTETTTADVLDDLDNLLSESLQKESIVNNAVKVLLQLPCDLADRKFDRKHCVKRGNFLVETFPAVLIAYRLKFWKELIAKVKESEAALQQVCSMEDVTNDVKGRLFELIVIARCQTQTISRSTADLGEGIGHDVFPVRVDSGVWFSGQNLPHPSSMTSNSLFIPQNSNFPAIDLIWKAGMNVWCVQVHVADHDDCLVSFKEICESRTWLTAFDNIYLVYLSPDPAVASSLTCLPPAATQQKIPRLAKAAKTKIQVSAVSKNEIECLKNMQWEAGCWTIDT